MTAASRRPKVLLVGWDGVRCDVLRKVNPPTLRGLADRGVFAETRMPDTTVASTVTAPGWSTILSGVWPDKHRVTSNEPHQTALAQYPDFLTRLTTLDKRWRTFAAVDAAMLATTKGPGPLLGPGVSTLVFHNRLATPGGFATCDRRVAADAATHLRHQDVDAAFVYFGHTDDVGHAHGTTGSEYRAAIMQADTYLKDLLDAVRVRPSYDAEDWLVVVTTDHGHVDGGGHGGDSWQERQSFVVAAGGGVTPLDDGYEVRNVDIVPTLLHHLGVAVDPAWDLDGKRLPTTADLVTSSSSR